MTEETLFAKLGGDGAVAAVVDIFYDRVLNDSALWSVFDGVDMNRLKRHQAMFVTAATGGPQPPAPFDLTMAHSRLGITDDQFDKVAAHLVASLRVAAVDQSLIDQVVALVVPLRSQVVTASPVSG
ncbi:MAG: group I truncated hemoglobin [Candidatus Dormibacteria bacterium]